MSKRPGEELASAVEKMSAPAVPGVVAEQMQTTPILDVVPVDKYTNEYFAQRRQEEAAKKAQLAYNRQLAVQHANQFGPEFVNSVTIKRNPYNMQYLVTSKPLPIESDPLVQQMVGQRREVEEKLAALTPLLTGRQQEYLKKRWLKVTNYTKGKKTGPKAPTAVAMNKVLFRAIEMHAQRRSAQLGMQARRAARERHALMNHKKPLYLADGSTIGKNKRYFKKIATNSVRKHHEAEGRAAAREISLNITTNNKAERVAIAKSHDRKVNKKDEQPAKR